MQRRNFLLLLLLLASACAARHHGVSREHVFQQQLRQQQRTADADPPVQLFEQRVDHFNPADSRTWKQGYQVDTSLWGGKDFPVFVMLGGEGPMGTASLGGHYVIREWAAKARAAMISIEHRFYGKSIPLDGTLSLDNLRYLTTEQALTDYAVLIQAVKSDIGATDRARVVTFGGSYSGSLSAWMRAKFPHVVFAALASSAPVLAQMDFPEYFEVVTNSVGPTCAARIKEAFSAVDGMLDTSQGCAMLERDFAACTKIGSELDKIEFVEGLSDSVAGIVQYSGDNNARGRVYNISRMCKIIEDTSFPSAYAAFAAFTLDYRTFVGENCTDSSYAQEVAELSNTDATADGASGRSWVWQTCVEYGYFQTGSASVPFGKRISLQYFTQLCQDVFGVKPASAIQAAVNNTNLWFGGRNIASSRIVLANGSVDPWHALGLTSTVDPQMPVFYIQGTAHCADLYASSADDLPALAAARNGAWTYISTWLAQ